MGIRRSNRDQEDLLLMRFSSIIYGRQEAKRWDNPALYKVRQKTDGERNWNIGSRAAHTLLISERVFLRVRFRDGDSQMWSQPGLKNDVSLPNFFASNPLMKANVATKLPEECPKLPRARRSLRSLIKASLGEIKCIR